MFMGNNNCNLIAYFAKKRNTDKIEYIQQTNKLFLR